MPQTGTPGAPGQGPWSAAVQQDFADDPALAARVEQFMATRYQPYVTRLEGEKAAAQVAIDFYNEFEEDAGEAYLRLSEKLFGEDGVDAIVTALGGPEEAEAEEAIESTATEEAPVSNLTPEQIELLQWAEEKRAEDLTAKERAEYDALKQSWLDADESRKGAVDPALFDPFVAANEGDFDRAFEAYKTFTGKFTPAQPDPVAPPALDTGTTVPGTEKRYTSFDDAWEAFEAEQRALKPAPPTV